MDSGSPRTDRGIVVDIRCDRRDLRGIVRRQSALDSASSRAGVGERVVPLAADTARVAPRKTVIAVAAGIATAIIRDSGPRSARNIPAEDAPIDLPPAAKDVCYGRGYRGGLVVEFTTDEVTFRKWAEEELSGFELDERHECGELDIPRTVNRHRSYYTEFEGPESVEIKHGLHFGWWLDDDVFADGYFDRSTGRAYYVKY